MRSQELGSQKTRDRTQESELRREKVRSRESVVLEYSTLKTN